MQKKIANIGIFNKSSDKMVLILYLLHSMDSLSVKGLIMYLKSIFKVSIFATISFMLSGCEFFDEMFQFKSQNNRQSSIKGIKYESDESKKNPLILSKCSINKPSYIYYETPEDAHRYIYKDTKNLLSKPLNNLKPHWDIRYLNGISRYKNSTVKFEKLTGMSFKDSALFVGTDASREHYAASVAGVKCVDGKVAAGVTVNLGDAPEEYVDYGGPHATFIYRLANNLNITRPWNSTKDGNLIIQANFTKPIYKNFEDNIGGGVNFGLILRNVKNNKYINYIIGVYAIGNGDIKERKNLLFDPTTKMVHISTVIDRDTKWATISPKSKESIRILSDIDEFKKIYNRWDNFYRVNITYDNLYAVLKELRDNPPADVADEDFGMNPEDWEISSVFIQYELDEDGGKALLSGSFRGFEVFTSKLPL